MANQTKTTGTESPDDGNELESSASTAPEGSDDRNAESGGDKDWKALAISLQEKAKRVNELEAKLKTYEEADPSPPVTESPEVQSKTSQIEEIEAKADEFRKRGDPVAALALDTRAELLRTQRDMILTRQLDRLPSDEQDSVLKHFNKNRHRLGDINAARSEIRERSLDEENKKLKERLSVLEKGPDEEVQKAPPTHGKEFTARETKAKLMTGDEYAAEHGRILRTQGDVAAREFAARLNRKEIQIKS